ncbi:RsmE family RNA methyltransferase [Mycoplasma sp. P36-A1]|uniref:RsmE family RNA methyltransferase n=1 Tax=Mycoplasma sp. P36-A1 TaxID=3252900 RepID=UPI003C2B04E8
MQQYMIHNSKFNNNKVEFIKDDLHHIYKVMRHNFNDKVEVVNINTNKKYLASLNDDSQSATIIKEIEHSSELNHELVLAYGLVKADKLEFVIQKAAELGVTKFIPLIMERSIVKYDQKKLAKKIERWQKIIKEACEQAHRNALMEIMMPISVKELMQYSKDINLVAYEEAKVDSKINKCIKQNKSVMLVVGPEGGISSKEIEVFKDNNYDIVTLGKRILRTETAVISSLAIITDLME